jgi:hypothetical protein
MDDREFKDEIEKFDKLEDQLVADREAGKEERWIFMCPGCKQIATSMRVSYIGISGRMVCYCGYPGPMVQIQESKIKDGSAIKELEEIEQGYYREHPGEFRKR